MANPGDLQQAENWSGSCYELAMELGARDDSRLERALLAVWHHASVKGCFVAEYEPYTGIRPLALLGHAEVPLSLRSLEESGQLRGVVRLPSGVDIVCSVVAVREDNGPDWLDFGVPLGALWQADPRIGGFPFGDDYGQATLFWRRPLDGWLAEIGSLVYAEVPFRLGLIGDTVSGRVYADQLAGRAPTIRDFGYLVPANDVLAYHEANS